jgi:hypothetical protein
VDRLGDHVAADGEQDLSDDVPDLCVEVAGEVLVESRDDEIP